MEHPQHRSPSPPVGIVQRNLGRHAALGMATAAVDEAERLGVHVNVAVVDRHGTLMAFLRMPDASLISVQTAMDKAYSAASARLATSPLVDVLAGFPGGRAAEHPAAPQAGGVRRRDSGRAGRRGDRRDRRLGRERRRRRALRGRRAQAVPGRRPGLGEKSGNAGRCLKKETSGAGETRGVPGVESVRARRRAPISTKNMRAARSPGLRQAWRVPAWTTTSPRPSRRSRPFPRSSSISPSMTTP